MFKRMLSAYGQQENIIWRHRNGGTPLKSQYEMMVRRREMHGGNIILNSSRDLKVSG